MTVRSAAILVSLALTVPMGYGSEIDPVLDEALAEVERSAALSWAYTVTVKERGMEGRARIDPAASERVRILEIDCGRRNQEECSRFADVLTRLQSTSSVVMGLFEDVRASAPTPTDIARDRATYTFQPKPRGAVRDAKTRGLAEAFLGTIVVNVEREPRLERIRIALSKPVSAGWGIRFGEDVAEWTFAPAGDGAVMPASLVRRSRARVFLVKSFRQGSETLLSDYEMR